MLAQLGAAQARSGQLSPLALQSTSAMLGQVQSMVRDAAAIEAKRADQRLSATHVLTLLVALRDDLKRRLHAAFGEAASAVVDEVFRAAKWTGGLREEDVKDALLEPAAFDFRLRVIDREGDAVRESATAHGLQSAEIAALLDEAESAENLEGPKEATDAP